MQDPNWGPKKTRDLQRQRGPPKSAGYPEPAEKKIPARRTLPRRRKFARDTRINTKFSRWRAHRRPKKTVEDERDVRGRLIQHVGPTPP
ncbi:hypothetical protein TNIN_439641 [Trichonephila inaurata madagascariensis]|uniref:Uncharacterized protein n=1 Tax=Trichonephila inaurata madagascariensis TaxID=2747483 RepID=A0A8X7CIT4_9ARAC|nr:hypothetical protein TNIN_439641 [Trichonephila inaurata madagascariensis]